MNDKIKRYNHWMSYDEAGMELDDEGEYVKYTDYESTRQALADTKAQLEALEDEFRFRSVSASDYGDLYVIQTNAKKGDVIYQAIQNSRARNKK